VVHPNAPLSPLGRWRLVRLVLEDGWPVARVAERFQVSRTTAYRWVGRYRQAGRAGLADRSSRPHQMPRLTPAPLVRKIKHLRLKRRWGPVGIAVKLGMAASTVHRVLVRLRLNRLAWMDRSTGAVVRRYEHPAPGSLVHVDVKKLGNIPAGGGHRVVGRTAGKRHRRADPTVRRSPRYDPLLGYGYVHAAVDDHSRLAYVEIHADELAATACGFWTRAHAWFGERGITVQRVLTDNGACYRTTHGGSCWPARGQAQTNPAVSAVHQRQGRAVQPHPARRMGLRQSVRHPPAVSPTSGDRTARSPYPVTAAASHQPPTPVAPVGQSTRAGWSPCRTPRPTPTRPGCWPATGRTGDQRWLG
jgi:transposase-like protein